MLGQLRYCYSNVGRVRDDDWQQSVTDTDAKKSHVTGFLLLWLVVDQSNYIQTEGLYSDQITNNAWINILLMRRLDPAFDQATIFFPA